MDDRRFDSLARSLANGASRRSVLKGILGLGSATLAGGILLDGETDAARRPTPIPPPPKCPGNQIPSGGTCICPPTAPYECGPACCTGTSADPPSPTHTECCDNACCHGTCYAEELCCPTNPGPSEQPPTHQVCRSAQGVECCPIDQHCCEVDGCCDTVCWGGEDGNSNCCPQGAFCPGDGTADICCTNNFICCGAGTSGNLCRDPNVENGCCTDSDCSSNQTCTDHICVDTDPCEGACSEFQVCVERECLCEPGTSGAGELCTPCAPGSYSDIPGSTLCDSCDLNTYQPDSGQTSCYACPPGTYTEHVRQTSCIACNCQSGNMPPICACPPDTCQPGFAPVGAECVACNPGFASSDGTACLPCPAGTYTTLTGSVQCVTCACGLTCDPATGNCPGNLPDYSACAQDSECQSGHCGCGAPPGFPECFCRITECQAPETDCAGSAGAVVCCEGDCTCFGGNTNCMCVTPE